MGSEGPVAAPLIRDLLFHLPVDVMERTLCPCITDAVTATRVVLVVRVVAHHPPPRTKAKKLPYKITCEDSSGELQLIYFHAAEFLRRQLPVGAEVAVAGRTERFQGVLQIAHPDAVVPVARLSQLLEPQALYRLTAELKQTRLQRWMATALDALPEIPEWISASVIAAEGWPSLAQALRQVHRPTSREALSPATPARTRLAYDEALASQLSLMLVRRFEHHVESRKMAIGGTYYSRMLATLPFQLTQGQRDVMQDIARDMASGRAMLSLLQGDVGSGKTIVAFLSMLAAVDHQCQAALMVPTNILANQHFQRLKPWCDAIGVTCVLLTGAQSSAEKRRHLAAMASGEASIVIGTHALFQKDVIFYNLGLAVIDEQHRFGVMQRMALAAKGKAPHLLLMTATPIPRSLTLTLYGDLDDSALREKPAGRQPIVTRAIPLTRESEIVERLGITLSQGASVYWICPLVGDDEAAEVSEFAAAVERHAMLEAMFPQKVGLVHGRMPIEQREAQMQLFANGVTKILVATTVIEVGVDVAHATVIVIENAERFGLAQLHQLRGRVGRGDQPSSCVLLYGDPLSDYAKERLRVIRDLDDGFAIAEEDLRLRGGGDMLGTRQSGLPDFRFIDLQQHGTLIRQARQEVMLYLQKDPALSAPQGKALIQLLHIYGYDRLVQLLRSG